MPENPAASRPPVDSGDAAWAGFPAPFPPDVMAEHCRDIEVLFRLNPYYYFDVWQQTGSDSFHVEFENQSNHLRQSLELKVSRDARGVTVTYSDGIKQRTVFTLEPAVTDTHMTVTDDYDRLPPPEREQRQSEVDRSLEAWARSLRIYFQRLKRWSWLPGWRWYIRRVWMPMKPSTRRIVWFIYLISVAEFFFFLFVLLIYLIEQNN